MTDIKKLIKLIRKGIGYYFTESTEPPIENYLADFLLENNAIVLPCKVGDTVYSFCDTFGGILEYFIENLNIAFYDENTNYYTYEANCNMNGELYDSIDFDCDDIGKNVFVSREEAEKALKEKRE